MRRPRELRDFLDGGEVCKWSFGDGALRDAIELINRGDCLRGSGSGTIEVDPEHEVEVGDAIGGAASTRNARQKRKRY